MLLGVLELFQKEKRQHLCGTNSLILSSGCLLEPLREPRPRTEQVNRISGLGPSLSALELETLIYLLLNLSYLTMCLKLAIWTQVHLQLERQWLKAYYYFLLS